MVAVSGHPSGVDLFDVGIGIAEPGEHLASVFAEAGRRETEALAGRGRKRNRDRRRQHLAFGGVLDRLEEPGFGEVPVGEQPSEIGDNAVVDIEMVEPLAPFGGGAPAHALDDECIEFVDIVGAAVECAEPLLIGQFRAVECRWRDCASVVARMQMCPSLVGNGRRCGVNMRG